MEKRNIRFATSLILWASVALYLAGPVFGAKIDCGPVTNNSNDLPRTAAIGTNPAGTGAHSLGSGLAAVASSATPISVRVQPFNGPNAWMPLLQASEIEFGIMNILDAKMAQTGTGNYKKPNPEVRVVSGGVFPFTVGWIVRDKSAIKETKDLKGKRMAWDYGGHAITQTLQLIFLEGGGVNPSDLIQVRVSNINDGARGVVEGRIDVAETGIGIGLVEEVNAAEPVRFLSLPNTDKTKAILAKSGVSLVKSEQVTGIKGDTYVIGYPLHLVSSTKVSERAIYTLVKSWWENLSDLQTKHPLFKKWTKEMQALTNFTVPYHPGAIKFYKEVGVWTSVHDARLKEICQ
jgi:TRAP transporter TAXI family solute receptor